MTKLIKDELKQAREIAVEKVDAIRPDLERILYKWYKSSIHMEHGQIKTAAKCTLRNLGYEWVLNTNVQEKYVQMYVHAEVKRLVKQVVGKWHDSPSRVWLQFRNYCLEMAAATAAKEALKKFRIAQ